MAPTIIPAQVGNPYVGTSPKSIPTDFEDIQWAAFVEKFERKETQITNLIPRGKDAYTGNKLRVAQKYNPFLTTTIKVLTANNSQNVDVTATAGMRVGDILRITDYQSGSTTALDYSTIEHARIESITDSDTVVLTRDMDTTTTGSWPVHPVGAKVELVSRASPNNTTFARANVVRPDFFYQYGQLFESSLEIAIQAKHTKVLGSGMGFWEDDRANVIADLKWERENAFATMDRMAGDETSTPTKPFTMGGITYQIANVASSNVNDLGNGLLDVWDIDDLLRQVWGSHRKGMGTHVLAHQDTIAIWDMLINPYRQATMSDTDFTLKTKTGNFRWASITPVPTISMPPGVMAFIDPKDWEWNNFEGEDWHEVNQDPEQIFKPNEAWAMWGRFSIICKDIYRQAMITNIQTDLTQYPGRAFGR